MTKEEKIKEAWGKYYEERKERIDENGWFGWYGRSWEKMKQRQQLLVDNRYLFDEDKYAYRPKTLQGIENNNGWIKILSEEDLPTPELKKEYYFISLEKNTSKSEIIRGFTDKTGKYFICSESYRTIFYNDTFYKITHYQPIVKPKPPIY